jgi:hypothetical protein
VTLRTSIIGRVSALAGFADNSGKCNSSASDPPFRAAAEDLGDGEKDEGADQKQRAERKDARQLGCEADLAPDLDGQRRLRAGE